LGFAYVALMSDVCTNGKFTGNADGDWQKQREKNVVFSAKLGTLGTTMLSGKNVFSSDPFIELAAEMKIRKSEAEAGWIYNFIQQYTKKDVYELPPEIVKNFFLSIYSAMQNPDIDLQLKQQAFFMISNVVREALRKKKEWKEKRKEE
jgi:hypothetical protein